MIFNGLEYNITQQWYYIEWNKQVGESLASPTLYRLGTYTWVVTKKRRSKKEPTVPIRATINTISIIDMTKPAIANPLGSLDKPIIEKRKPRNHKTKFAPVAQQNTVQISESTKPAIPSPFDYFSFWLIITWVCPTGLGSVWAIASLTIWGDFSSSHSPQCLHFFALILTILATIRTSFDLRFFHINH